MTRRPDYDRTHPDTAQFGVSGGVDFAPRGRRALRGYCPSRAERALLNPHRMPSGFTGVWHDEHYYVRGRRADHMRYAGAFGTREAAQ